MHDLKKIRKNVDAFKKAIQKRNVDIDFAKIIKLDIENKNLKDSDA